VNGVRNEVNEMLETDIKEVLRKINQPQSISSNLSNLRNQGGTSDLLNRLQTKPDRGLASSEIERRRSLYGSNSLPSSPRKSFWQLFVDTFDDQTLQILVVAAVVSLAVGLYEDPSGYVEGVAILVAVLIVSIVTAVNDYQKESQFRTLNQVNEESDIVLIRDGQPKKISTTDIVLGDIVSIEAGGKIPCDGVLVRSDGLEVDESALTGEPEDVKKDCLKEEDEETGVDPFVLSGCTVSAGTAYFVAIAVGKESQWGVIKSALESEQEQTPLQEKLDDMANMIGNVGIATAVATFIAMMTVKLVVQPAHLDDVSPWSHALEAFIIGVTIVVVAVPEGLPLAVTISLAYSTKKMLADNNLIRHLAACETMGNATNICSDKTGTLTENRMTVVSGIFADVDHDNIQIGTGSKVRIDDKAAELILEGVATCSTAQIEKTVDPKQQTSPQIIGNKTEGALLSIAASPFFSNDDYQVRRTKARFGEANGSRLFPFSSKRKRMSVLIHYEEEECWTLYHKGAAEVVLEDCTHYLASDGTVMEMTTEKKQYYLNKVAEYASRALRCVALAHRLDVQKVVSDPERATEDDCEKDLEKELVFDALVGIADPLRGDVVEAVKTCQNAGIMVRMVTGDSLDTASSIAKQAGILTDDGIAMLGKDFRLLTPAELDEKLPKLQVLARSSPDDKYILVTRLNGGLIPKSKEEWLNAHPGMDFDEQKEKLLPGYYDEWAKSRNGKGEVVGVTGDGTNDGPALKAADVGLSMGLSGTDVAKNASDIILMDDRFSSIVKAVLWGRSVYDNIRKFLQFQLTVNVVALTITFLSAVVGYTPPLNAVMMLWVNLIMDTMGALALGTEPPTEELLDRRPYRRSVSLINKPMWRNILSQSIYQLILLVVLLDRGAEIFGCEDGSNHHFTIMFNAFVFCQVFNEFNAREIGDRFDPLRDLLKSPIFLAVIFFTVILQWFIVTYGGDFTQTVPLTKEEWQLTISLGAVSIPIGYLMRQIPIEEDPKTFAGKIPHQLKKQEKDTDQEQFFMLLVPIVAALIYSFSRLSISKENFENPEIVEEMVEFVTS